MATTIFDAAQLAAAVQQTLLTVPDGHTNALVGSLDPTGAQVLLTLKAGQGWDVTAMARHNWSGDNVVGASLIYSW